jgi:hypothetical protein
MPKSILEQETESFEFSKKHGFAWVRPQDFKNCITIHWKYRRKRNKTFIDYDRITEQVDIMHRIFDKYIPNWTEEWLDSEYRLSTIGIHSFTHYCHKVWAIPNEYKDIQDHVISVLPEWAEVRVKC